jgi:hypothetical protein
MVIKKPGDIKSSEITDEKTYLSRRNFLRAGLLAGTTLATAGLYRFFNQPPPREIKTEIIESVSFRPAKPPSRATPKILSRARGRLRSAEWCKSRKPSTSKTF